VAAGEEIKKLKQSIKFALARIRAGNVKLM
jgi:hypothetical protein